MVWADQRLQLGNQIVMTAQRELRPDPFLHGHHAKLLEPRGLHLGERLVGDIREGRAAPEPERLPQHRRSVLRLAGRQVDAGACEEPLEPVDVQLVRLDHEPIAAALGRDALLPETLAQRMHLDLQGVGGCRRRTFTPDRVDQPVTRDDLASLQKKAVKQQHLPAGAERHRAAVVEDLEGTEDAELHGVSSLLLVDADRRASSEASQPILGAFSALLKPVADVLRAWFDV